MQGQRWSRKDFVNSISQKMQAILSEKHNVENEALDNKELAFRFYEVMKYPIPLEKDLFAYHSKKKV